MSDESERANKPKQNRFLQYIGRRAFAGELLTFFGALLLGRVCIAGDIAPFGLAFLAAATISGCNAHYAFAGAVFGAILLQAEPQYPAVCACVLYYVMHLLWLCWSGKGETLDRLFLLFLAQAAMLPIFHASDVSSLLRAALQRLSPREKRIVELRFGLNDQPECTQKQVADLLGISQSYISRLEKRIIKRLHKEMVRMQ